MCRYSIDLDELYSCAGGHAVFPNTPRKVPKKPGEGEQCIEWVMLELQGSLETRMPVPLSSKFVGDLHFSQQKDVPILIIGHHILYGKTVDLEKPYAVLVKNSPSEEIPTDSVTETSYHVKAIIKKKLLFKQRPKPIIANVPKKL